MVTTPAAHLPRGPAFSIRKHANTGSQFIGLVAMPNHRHTTTVTVNDPLDLDAESQHSRTHIIKETRTFAVEDATNKQLRTDAK